jgi:hypothetical protein
MTRQGIPFRPDYSAARNRTSGIALVRAAAAQLLYAAANPVQNLLNPNQRETTPLNKIWQDRWPNDKSDLAFVQKAASSVATQTTPGWAQELAGRGISDIISLLGPDSAAATAMSRGLQFQWQAGYGNIAVAGVLADKSSAGFVKPGDAIPVKKFDTSKGIELIARKFATIIPFTTEVREHSTPNLESLVKSYLTEGIALALDDAFLDTNAASDTRCAGLRNGINATAASASADTEVAMRADVGTLIGAVAPVALNHPILMICSPKQAATLDDWRSGRNLRYEILYSGALAAGTIICVATNCLASACDATPRFEAERSVTVVMDDTAPGDVVAAGTANAGTVKSMFQIDSVALKAVFKAAWGLRSATGLAWMQSVVW